MSLDDLRLLGEAVNALRVGAEALAGAGMRLASAARDLGHQTGDGRIAPQYDATFANTQRTLRTMQDCWVRLGRGLDTVADAYAESSGPSMTSAGAP